jgi:LPS-assembly lipoprotein
MRALLVIALLTLSACGFRPLYEAGGSSAAMQSHLSGIEVAPIADRLGQVMRNRLLERLNVGSAPEYRLSVVLTQTTEGYGIRPDAAVTQEQLTLTATVIFAKLGEEELIFSEDMRARTSYDLVLSDFASVTQREDSARRLALELAERIHRRLALYFTRKEEASR